MISFEEYLEKICPAAFNWNENFFREEEEKMLHDVDGENVNQLAHEIGEIKKLCDRGDMEKVKKLLDHLWSQVQHLDNVHDEDDDETGGGEEDTDAGLHGDSSEEPSTEPAIPMGGSKGGVGMSMGGGGM